MSDESIAEPQTAADAIPRRKPGRKPTGRERQVQRTIWFTAQELAAVTELAREADLTLSDYIRARILASPRTRKAKTVPGSQTDTPTA